MHGEPARVGLPLTQATSGREVKSLLQSVRREEEQALGLPEKRKDSASVRLSVFRVPPAEAR
jgi:hypothetical protein